MLARLPPDLQNELSKFVCPYTLSVKDRGEWIDVILRFPSARFILNIDKTSRTREEILDALILMRNPDHLEEDTIEEIYVSDYIFGIDKKLLRVMSSRERKLFKVPICRILIDVLTWVAYRLPGAYTIEEAELEFLEVVSERSERSERVHA